MDVWTPSEGTTGGIPNQAGEFTPAPPNGPLLQTGTILPFASYAIPDNWLTCDGSYVNISAYGALYDVIGTSYDPSPPAGTFKLPDYRGRSNQFVNNLYDISGSTQVTLVAQNLPPHTHTNQNNTTIQVEPTGGAFPTLPVSPTLNNILTTIPGSMRDENGNTIPQPPAPFNIVNPFLVVRWIIKT
jgi:microcystin-dependent protein